MKRIVYKNHRDWHTQLHYALWAYRTSVRSSIGTTPYNLVYSSEAIMPLELEIPTLRIALLGLDDTHHRKQRLHQLEMLDEQCSNALEHLHAYCKRKHHHYNLNVIPQSFHKGDLVLSINQCNINVDPNERGKFSSKWLGPYNVDKTFGSGAYMLTKLDRTPLKEPINVMHLCWYYI